ncbi:MAG: large conductance mechanosensitive channel protein MscL [Actinomycetota bacterium]|nr:large conductance mechanosensitive channel protein MscL [Actinomycetota bacterium]
MIDEFKEFALKGNLIELAVAFILGLAFSAVVTALVNGVFLQIIAAIVGQPSFDQLSINLNDTPILYGSFLTALVNFLLVAFVLFLVVKAVNRLQRPAEEPPAPATRNCPFCFTAIQAEATRCSACTSEVIPTEGPRAT